MQDFDAQAKELERIEIRKYGVSSSNIVNLNYRECTFGRATATQEITRCGSRHMRSYATSMLT
jgi:hypothetical protein